MRAERMTELNNSVAGKISMNNDRCQMARHYKTLMNLIQTINKKISETSIMEPRTLQYPCESPKIMRLEV